MDKPTQLQSIIDRYDTRMVVTEERPVLHGRYRVLHFVFIGLTLIQGLYSFSTEAEDVKRWLPHNTVEFMGRPLAVFGFTELDSASLYMFMTLAGLWAVSAMQEKDFSLTRWCAAILGALTLNYGLVAWLDKGDQVFVLYWGFAAFIISYAFAALTLPMLTDPKTRRSGDKLLKVVSIFALLAFGLFLEPQYTPSAIMGGAMSVWIALKHSETHL